MTVNKSQDWLCVFSEDCGRSIICRWHVWQRSNNKYTYNHLFHCAERKKESHFTGPRGHRIANIAQEPLVHHIHHHFQSGGPEDARLSAKINIYFHRGCNCSSALLQGSQQPLSGVIRCGRWAYEGHGSKMEDILVIAVISTGWYHVDRFCSSADKSRSPWA